MIYIALEDSNGQVLAKVADDETGSSTSIGADTEAEAIQKALDWADVEVSITQRVDSDSQV